MQSSSVSLEVVETEIKATEEVLKKYRNNGYNNTVPCAREATEALQINSGFVESRTRKKRRMFKYETEDERCKMSQRDQLTTNFLPLIDYAKCFLQDRFEQKHTVGTIFDFHCNQKDLV